MQRGTPPSRRCTDPQGRPAGGLPGGGRYARARRLRAPQLPVLLCAVATACASGPPRNPENLCAVFRERGSWFEAARDTERSWRVPIPVQMAVIHQESRFVSDARPPRRRLLWLLPGPRRSSAYGYAQALESTWDEYRRATGRGGADRDDFEDAVDFVGWYGARARRAGVPSSDAYRFYLAYHEGPNGFRRGTHRGKPWLLRRARAVATRADRYGGQLASCREDLESSGFWPF